MNRALFGPSGACELYAAEGFSSTVNMAKWLRGKGLDLFEYSFGKGVRMSANTAIAIGKQFAEYSVEMSVHAPYYVNFASEEEQKIENSFNYVLDSLKAAKLMGGRRCVVHMGSPLKQDYDKCVDRVIANTVKLVRLAKDSGLGDMIICPETMGKSAQIGTVDDIARICEVDEMLIPCVDFGHVNARTGGGLVTVEEYERIIRTLGDALGNERVRQLHVHFSHIQYTAKGEVKHLTFEDNEYGPYFAQCCRAIINMDIAPHVLCESAGTQTIDAITMKNIYEEQSRSIDK